MKRAPLPGALALVLAAGCGSVRVEQQEKVVVLAPPAPSPRAPAASEQPRAVPPVPIEKIGLDEVACVQRPPSVELAAAGKSLALCDPSLERCFLEARTGLVRSSGMVLSIERAKAPRWLLEARVEGIVLRGFVDKLKQAPARPFVMSGFYIPRVIEVEEGIRDGLRVTANVERFVVPVTPLRAEIGCSDLMIGRKRDFGAEDLVLVTKMRGKPDPLELDPTPLFDGDGAKVAELSPSPHTLVDGYRVRKGKRFIQLELSDGIVFGWVPTSALHKPTVGMGMGFGTGTGRTPEPRPVEAGQRCDHDLPVIAFFPDRRFEVGTVPAGTWFTATTPIDGDHREIDLFRPRGASDTREAALFRPPRGVKLGVPSATLRRCETR